MSEPRKRANILDGRTHRISTGCGNMYITVNHDDDGLFEAFAHLGKSGQCGAAQLEAIGRLATFGLRGSLDPMVIIKQLRGIRCPSMVWQDGEQITSCADAIGRAIAAEYKYLEDLKALELVVEKHIEEKKKEERK